MTSFVQGLHLVRREENADEIATVLSTYGKAVGIGGVVHDLNRKARATKVPGRAPRWGFTWNEQDNASESWWPQGITTSADASDTGDFDGRRLVLVSWYSHGTGQHNEGSRITVVDLETMRYRHVLVVKAGKKGLEPLRIHAGGIVWCGPYLHLAGTRRGLFTCHVDDIMKVTPSKETFDHRYVLPVRMAYSAHNDESVEQLRYSFLSLDRQTSPPQLLAGEYGVKGQTTRLVRYPLDPETFELHRDENGHSRPIVLDDGIGHMQGAAVVGESYYITQSRGRSRLGRLYVGRSGALRPRRWALPPGPEDISYWPEKDQLWSLSEYPRRRFVFAMDRKRLKLLPSVHTFFPSLSQR